MAKERRSGGCCSCVTGIIGLVLIVILVVAAIFVSKYISIDQVGLADTPGILCRFSDSYTQEATFRTEGMEKWKVYDVVMWIIKSGEYTPA